MRSQLIKLLPITDGPKVFRIELDAYYYCLWNEVRVLASVDLKDTLFKDGENKRAVTYDLKVEVLGYSLTKVT